MATFNLLTEPWIPVADRSGNIKEMGILDTLREAHEQVEISDPSPLVQFGIYRMLIAFVMDALELKNKRGLVRAIERTQFDMAVIDAYAERWKNRFDLFDKEHPFMQYPESCGLDKNTKPWPIQYLIQHLSPSLNDEFINHGIYDDQALSFEQCARGLMAIPPFTFYVGIGYIRGLNQGPPLYILIKGDNLFQNILYNSCVIDPSVKPLGNEPPVWRSDMVMEPEKIIDQFSLLQGLTWRPRRIRLIPGEGGTCTYTGIYKDELVHQMYFGGGFKASDSWADPQVAYKLTSKGKNPRQPIKPVESREPWRDIGPLMLLHEADYLSSKNERFEMPSIITQYKGLVDLDEIDKKNQFVFETYGLRKDLKEVRLHEWTFERLCLPWNILKIKNAGKHVQDAIDSADIVADGIKEAIKIAYPTPKKDKKRVHKLNNIIEKAIFTYWSSIKPLFMGWFLKELSEQYTCNSENLDAPQILLGIWKDNIMKKGADCLDNALDPLDTNAKELEKRVIAHKEYWRSVNSKLHLETRKLKSNKGGRKKNDH